jgi:diguanylate cyclase (GGDEF)-like protein
VSVVDQASWFWMMLNMLGGLVLLAVRASRRSDRRELAPLLIGTAVGVVPLVLLVAVPRLIGLRPLVPTEVAAIPAAAIPISFAYAILRHQVFGLDVLVRRVLLRVTAIFMGVIGFLVGWLGLQTTGLPSTEAALVSVAVAGLVMPTVSDWVARRLDAWLYRPLSALRSPKDPLQAATLDILGAEVTLHLRQLLPLQWAACIIHDETTPLDRPSRRLLGADGQIPAWLSEDSLLQQSPTEVTVAPIHRFDTGVVLLLAGPLLDGGSLGGIQFEAMRVLARRSGSAFEASMLRENAEDETRFRQGLTDMARALSAAATVNDVLHCLSTHTERLLGAHAASLWRYGADGEVALLEVESNALKPSAKVLRDLVQLEVAHGREREWTVVSEDGTSLAFALDDGADQPIVCLVRRAYDANRFGSRDERRARELTQHTSGALRRAAEREILEEQLRHRAFYDSLTGLPNRALFLDRIAHGVARSDRLGQELAVLFIDLDRFKVINDSLGHSAGDQLLVQVGRRLRSCLRESDTIARLGGDEFTVLLEGRSAVADAMQAAERILAVLRAPFTIDGQEAYAAASIGISGGTSIRESGRDLLREADIALYRAKAAGRGRYTLFEPRMNHLPVEHLHLESELHRAIERSELRVHYQPIFALNDGRITGLEALVRWEHPDKGLIPPGHFIPLAEDTGLIVPIGKWVLEEACQQMRQWQLSFAGAEDMFVSVNVSARQLQDQRLLRDVEEALHNSGLYPGHLQLEITESVVMQEPEVTVVKLNALKGLGIKLAVDDFGTGYSSLAYLKRFPIDVLKVDRAFVGGLAQGGHDSAIVQTVVSLAKALGLHTTAEGIEERSQWTMLEKLGCDQGQGFVFSRPLKAFDIEALLATSNQSERVAAA